MNVIDRIDRIANLGYYTSIYEVMGDLELLREVGHLSSENRLENSSYPVCYTTRQVITKIVMASNGIAMMGRLGSANTVVVGVGIKKILTDLNIHDVLGDMDVFTSDELDKNEVLCCRLCTRLQNRDIFLPYYQFFGFTATLEIED